MALHVDNSISPNSVNLFIEQASKGLNENRLFQLYEPFKVFKSIIDEAYKMQESGYINISSPLTISSDGVVLYTENSTISKTDILNELVLILGSYKNVSIDYSPEPDLLPFSALVLVVEFLQKSLKGVFQSADEIFLNNNYILNFYTLYDMKYSNIKNVYNTSLILMTVLKNVKLIDGVQLGNEDILFASRNFYLLKGELVKINIELEWNQNVVNFPTQRDCAFKITYSPGVYIKKPGLNISPVFDSGRSSLRAILK